MNETLIIILARRIFTSNQECKNFLSSNILDYEPETIKQAKIRANKLMIVLRMKFDNINPENYLYLYDEANGELSINDIIAKLKQEKV